MTNDGDGEFVRPISVRAHGCPYSMMYMVCVRLARLGFHCAEASVLTSRRVIIVVVIDLDAARLVLIFVAIARREAGMSGAGQGVEQRTAFYNSRVVTVAVCPHIITALSDFFVFVVL